MEQRATIKHLENKFSLARYELIIACEPQELKFYLYLKLYAINKSSAFPDQETIKKDLGWEEDTTRYWVKKMVEKKRLKYTPGTGRKSSMYDITWYDRLNLRGGKIQSSENSNPRGRKIPGGTIRNITTNNTLATSNEVAQIRDYFIRKFKEKVGKEPEMAFAKEGKLIKEKLKRYSVDELKQLINQFFNSKIGEDLGYTLSVCLSEHTINLWKAGKLEKNKKPYYLGDPIVQRNEKWYVNHLGEWLEFAGKEDEIEWK